MSASNEYSLVRTLTKALWTFLGGASGGGGAIGFLNSIEGWDPAWNEVIVVACASLGAAAVRGLINWAKNHDRGKIWLGAELLLFFAAGLVMQGCAGINPALMGKASGNQVFEEQTAAVINPETGEVTAPATYTRWTNNWKAPAGADISQMAGMRYKSDGDGWDLNISGDSDADTSGQAAAIAQIAGMQYDALKTGMQIGGGFLTAALPLGEMAIQGSNERGMYRLQNPGVSKFQAFHNLLADPEVRAWAELPSTWRPPMELPVTTE